MIVMKFGGASLADAPRIRRVCVLVKAHRRRKPVLVLSALRGVTDELIRVATAAAAGDRESAEAGSAALADRHRQVAARLFPDPAGREAALHDVSRLLAEVEDLFRGIGLLGELSHRSLDLVCSVGERLSARIVAAALAGSGVPAAYVDARAVVVTDGDHGRAHVDFAATNRNLRRLVLPRVRRGEIPVVTGFIGATPEGVTTTLGRGGSDYSASILGAGLEASEIWVWKEVDGVCTADPTLFPEARVVPHISYQEAAELAHFGAEVLHPRTMLPAMRRGIPIRVRNTLRPASGGTVISERGSRKANPLIISSIDGLSLVTVEGAGLVGSPAMVARVLSEVASLGVNLYMVSMASSEYNVSFAIPGHETARTVGHLAGALDVGRRNGGPVENVQVEGHVAIIAAVGARMKGQVGIAGRVFSALGRHGVNILAIAQGSSEFNITMVVAPEAFPVSALAHRVAVRDGHLLAVSVELRQRADPEEAVLAFESFAGPEPVPSLPSSPASPLVVRTEPDRPQPRRDRMTGGGMSVVLGRIRPCGALGLKFSALVHNTIRGAAGAAVQNAELLVAGAVWRSPHSVQLTRSRGVGA